MQSDQYADGDYYLTYGDGFRSTMLADQASSSCQTMETILPPSAMQPSSPAPPMWQSPSQRCTWGSALSGGTIYSDGL